ncbi:AraC family transcriptional regulator [Paenibacillus sp. WQ 127069]|uniref:AraC family transcriptional regulator n=1 Tax=Paenibacillus baimaensis TaxID=2982185 RepID=A0ABT2U8H1_9BACL|nr:AraC family transcriptional regulator [Paenibacillus sp. WQ 127069]MCU6790928.1 AraC family transcriptional regulator [Paenibacillus sp. WQ 127069]
MISGARAIVSTISADAGSGRREIESDWFVSSLADSLLMIQLLETNDWTAAERKLRDLFAKWNATTEITGEHRLEMYYMLCMTYSYAAHRQGKQPELIMGSKTSQMNASPEFISLKELEAWAIGILFKLKAEYGVVEPSNVPHRNETIHHIQQIVQQNLHEDVSLQLLSDKVNLHPKYVSWLYKNETGEGFNDYVHRLKMERAVHFLRNSSKKVYEIAEHLGYHHTSYFIRVFKERFHMTPQQFRDQ